MSKLRLVLCFCFLRVVDALMGVRFWARAVPRWPWSANSVEAVEVFGPFSVALGSSFAGLEKSPTVVFCEGYVDQLLISLQVPPEPVHWSLQATGRTAGESVLLSFCFRRMAARA